MNSLKRFKETVQFGKPDHAFMWPIVPHWCYPNVLARWHGEGLPAGVDVNTFLGYDRLDYAPFLLDLDPLFPAAKSVRISEDEETGTYRDDLGNVVRHWKNKDWGMSHRIEYGLKGRNDWEKYRSRLNPRSPTRFPENMEEWKRSVKNRDYPLGIIAGSTYGWIRNWMGPENISLMLYDDPEFIKEMMDCLADFMCETVARWVEGVQFDFAIIWEDLGMKTGPLISPDHFRQFCLPAYRRVIALLKAHGVNVIMVDSDGNNDPILPLWLEVGVNCLYPLEVAAGNDAVAMRRQYGERLILFGGIDKRALSKTKADVEEEVMKKVPDLVKAGGYLPMLDHVVPPEVPYENFRYYLELLAKIQS